MITVGVDIDRVASAAREILSAIGDDPDRDGLRDTPMRFARMYAELFEGLHQNPAETLSTVFREDHQEMVIVRDIPFYSMCEHHLLPFHGLAHFGYLPDGKIIGTVRTPDAATDTVTSEAFGDSDGKVLYICTNRSLFRIRMKRSAW